MPLLFDTFQSQGVWAEAGCGVGVGEVELVDVARGVVNGDGAEVEVVKIAGIKQRLITYLAL